MGLNGQSISHPFPVDAQQNKNMKAAYFSTLRAQGGCEKFTAASRHAAL
jgi:hypothetical protein